MTSLDPGYLIGRLLVAMPGVEDSRFERSVVLLCLHDQNHAMGLVINRPVGNLTLEGLFRQLDVDPGRAGAEPVLWGGPVEPERGFVLHSDDQGLSEASLRICGGLALTATRDILEGLAGRRTRPRQAAMAVGYSGWGAGQLESEIRNNVWLTCEPDEALLFDADYPRKWSRALAKIGVSAARLTPFSGRA